MKRARRARLRPKSRKHRAVGRRQSNRRPDDSKIAVQRDPHQRIAQPDHRPKATAERAAAQAHLQGNPRYTTLGLKPDRRPPHSSPQVRGIYAGYNKWLARPPAGRYRDQTPPAWFRPGSKNRSGGGPPVPARTSCQWERPVLPYGPRNWD